MCLLPNLRPSRNKSEHSYGAESTVLAYYFRPENATVDHETRTNNVDTIKECIHNCHCNEFNQGS